MPPARLSPLTFNSKQRQQQIKGKGYGMMSLSIVGKWWVSLVLTVKDRGIQPLVSTRRGEWTMTSSSNMCSTPPPSLPKHARQAWSLSSSEMRQWTRAIAGCLACQVEVSWHLLVPLRAKHDVRDTRNRSNVRYVQDAVPPQFGATLR